MFTLLIHIEHGILPHTTQLDEAKLVQKLMLLQIYFTVR